MKRKNLILKSAILSLGLAFVITGCGDDDLTDPVVTITGDNPIVIDLGGTYTELGATATDEQDGDLSTTITIDATDVNANAVGKYTVVYSVVDEAGNTGEDERQVWVRATADDYEGFYDVVESCTGSIPSYEIEIQKVNATTLKVFNLGDFTAGDTEFEITISGDLNEVLTINGADATDPSTTCNATGTLLQGSTSGSFDMNWSYSFDDGSSTFSCDDVSITQN
ncbi:MAG: DUF5011 domain-containing protein [Fimbriimonadaceae bacterium]|nr:DUF5011 domain-containing protein [Chitinophagales bacterium]